MKKAQLSVEFILLLAVIMFIGSAIIVSQVQQIKTFDKYGDQFESQIKNEQGTVALQSVAILGSYASSSFPYIFYEYTSYNTSSLLTLKYQDSLSQSAIPGIILPAQSLTNKSLVTQTKGGMTFE